MHTLQAAYLALCPVTNHKQAAMGLFISSVMAQDVAQARRVAPEPLCFAVGMLQQLAPTSASSSSTCSGAGNPVELNLAHVVSCAANDSFFATAAFRSAALAVAARVVRTCAEGFGDVAAAPELFVGALQALQALEDNPHCRDQVCGMLLHMMCWWCRNVCIGGQHVHILYAFLG